MRCFLILLVPATVVLSGCAWLSEFTEDVSDSVASAANATGEAVSNAASATAEAAADAYEAVKPIPYDAPGTGKGRLSPEVLEALAQTGPSQGYRPFEDDDATGTDVRLYRLAQGHAVARTAHDRAWLLLEEGQLLASANRCDEARARFREILDAADAPHPQRLQAQVELGRMDAGVCWTTQRWNGYRYRPAPKYPPKKGRFHIEGDVELLLHVTPGGGIREAVVVRSTLKALEPYALNAVYRWRFEPLEVDGRPIPFTLRQTLQFRYPQIFISE